MILHLSLLLAIILSLLLLFPVPASLYSAFPPLASQPFPYHRFSIVPLSLLALFILTANLIGLIPSVPTLTAQIFLTASLAFIFLVGFLIVSFAPYGFHFPSFFVMHAPSMALTFVLTILESFSLVARLIALAVRLFCNLMSGHVLLKVLLSGISVAAVFTFSASSTLLGTLGASFGLLVAISILIGVCALELGVAMLQAYVFVVLIILAV